MCHVPVRYLAIYRDAFHKTTYKWAIVEENSTNYNDSLLLTNQAVCQKGNKPDVVSHKQQMSG